METPEGRHRLQNELKPQSRNRTKRSKPRTWKERLATSELEVQRRLTTSMERNANGATGICAKEVKTMKSLDHSRRRSQNKQQLQALAGDVHAAALPGTASSLSRNTLRSPRPLFAASILFTFVFFAPDRIVYSRSLVFALRFRSCCFVALSQPMVAAAG